MLRKRLYKAIALIVILMASGTIGFHFLLPDLGLLRSFYLTVITLTTVGYGDISPLTSTTESNQTMPILFSVFLILFGISTFLYGVGILTEYITSTEMRAHRSFVAMQKKIAKLENHYIICGAGETGKYIAKELATIGRSFLIIDKSQDAINAILEELPNTCYVLGEATEDEMLINAGIKRAKGIAITISNERDTLFLIVSIKELAAENSCNYRIVASCTNEAMAKKLTQIGAASVVRSEHSCARRMVAEMFHPAVANFLDKMLREKEIVVRFDEAVIPENSDLDGVCLKDAGIRRLTGLNICAIGKPQRSAWMINPPGDYVLRTGDALIVVGEVENTKKLRRMIHGK